MNGTCNQMIIYDMYIQIQGVQDQISPKEIALLWERNTLDPRLVKPKCVWKIYIFYGRFSFLKKIEKKVKF